MKRKRQSNQTKDHFDSILDRAGRFVGLPSAAALVMDYMTNSSKSALIAFFIVMGILILMKWLAGDSNE